MEIELYKMRGPGGCIKAAYDLFTNNLKTIVRKTWLQALVFAIINACAVFIKLPADAPAVVTPDVQLQYAKVLAALLGLAVLITVAYTWLNTSVVSLLNGQSVARNMPRVIRQMLLLVGIVVLWLLVMAVGGSLTLLADAGKAGPSPSTLAIACGVAAIIGLAGLMALPPLGFSTMKYFMEPQQKVRSIVGKPYAQGWRRWGFLFLVFFLTAIIAGIIYGVVTAPTMLLSLSQLTNDAGIRLGDAPGLPAYFTALSFVVALACSFVWTYVLIWSEMVVYYAYGSIEARFRQLEQNK